MRLDILRDADLRGRWKWKTGSRYRPHQYGTSGSPCGGSRWQDVWNVQTLRWRRCLYSRRFTWRRKDGGRESGARLFGGRTEPSRCCRGGTHPPATGNGRTGTIACRIEEAYQFLRIRWQDTGQWWYRRFRPWLGRDTTAQLWTAESHRKRIGYRPGGSRWSGTQTASGFHRPGTGRRKGT